MPNRPEPALPRLYAILDVDAAHARGLAPLDLARLWIAAGVTLLQIRAKSHTFGPFTALARDVLAIAAPAGARVVVNDRADVAAIAGAHGVHVGQDDLSPGDVRHIAGPGALIGLSTHTPAQLEQALGEPIDYVAVGPVFQTQTKPSSWAALGVAGVRAAVAQVSGRLPVVAIGGITRERAGEVLDAGASSVAVISDLLIGDHADRVRAFL